MTTTHTLKTGISSLIVAASFGLLCLPAKADKIIQINTQTTGQDGYSNTSVQQNTQTAEIDKKKIKPQLDRSGDYDYMHGADESGRNGIGQGSNQLTNQSGKRNTSVNQNTQDAGIRRDRNTIIYPR